MNDHEALSLPVYYSITSFGEITYISKGLNMKQVPVAEGGCNWVMITGVLVQMACDTGKVVHDAKSGEWKVRAANAEEVAIYERVVTRFNAMEAINKEGVIDRELHTILTPTVRKLLNTHPEQIDMVKQALIEQVNSLNADIAKWG